MCRCWVIVEMVVSVPATFLVAFSNRELESRGTGLLRIASQKYDLASDFSLLRITIDV